MQEGQKVTIYPNFLLSFNIWFLVVIFLWKLGKMVVFGLSGIKYGIKKHTYKLSGSLPCGKGAA